MSGNGISRQKKKRRIRRAAKTLNRNPSLKVPEAMRAACFSLGDSLKPTLQQRVRRDALELRRRQSAIDDGTSRQSEGAAADDD